MDVRFAADLIQEFARELADVDHAVVLGRIDHIVACLRLMDKAVDHSSLHGNGTLLLVRVGPRYGLLDDLSVGRQPAQVPDLGPADGDLAFLDGLRTEFRWHVDAPNCRHGKTTPLLGSNGVSATLCLDSLPKRREAFQERSDARGAGAFERACDLFGGSLAC